MLNCTRSQSFNILFNNNQNNNQKQSSTQPTSPPSSTSSTNSVYFYSTLHIKYNSLLQRLDKLEDELERTKINSAQAWAYMGLGYQVLRDSKTDYEPNQKKGKTNSPSATSNSLINYHPPLSNITWKYILEPQTFPTGDILIRVLDDFSKFLPIYFSKSLVYLNCLKNQLDEPINIASLSNSSTSSNPEIFIRIFTQLYAQTFQLLEENLQNRYDFLVRNNIILSEEVRLSYGLPPMPSLLWTSIQQNYAIQETQNTQIYEKLLHQLPPAVIALHLDLNHIDYYDLCDKALDVPEKANDEINLPQLLDFFYLLQLFCRSSQPYCSLSPTPGQIITFDASTCKEIKYINNYSEKTKNLQNGDDCLVLFPGLYFSKNLTKFAVNFCDFDIDVDNFDLAYPCLVVGLPNNEEIIDVEEIKNERLKSISEDRIKLNEEKSIVPSDNDSEMYLCQSNDDDSDFSSIELHTDTIHLLSSPIPTSISIVSYDVSGDSVYEVENENEEKIDDQVENSSKNDDINTLETKNTEDEHSSSEYEISPSDNDIENSEDITVENSEIDQVDEESSGESIISTNGSIEFIEASDSPSLKPEVSPRSEDGWMTF